MSIEYQILLILLIHWVADFLMQSQKMAMNKSKDNTQLLKHCFVYSSVWIYFGMIFFPVFSVIIFAAITFFAHFITDYITSRWTSCLYREGKYYGFPGFFAVIGLDQFLHFTQLILCYKYLVEMNT